MALTLSQMRTGSFEPNAVVATGGLAVNIAPASEIHRLAFEPCCLWKDLIIYGNTTADRFILSVLIKLPLASGTGSYDRVCDLP